VELNIIRVGFFSAVAFAVPLAALNIAFAAMVIQSPGDPGVPAASPNAAPNHHAQQLSQRMEAPSRGLMQRQIGPRRTRRPSAGPMTPGD
jgi:hypothetical protein